MPYKLSGNCVVKADTGETVKCHDTHAQALAHLRALEANVEDAKSMKVGARNNKMDRATIQAMHDAACMLGAVCGEMEPDADEAKSAPAEVAESPLKLDYVKSLQIAVPDLAVKYVARDQIRHPVFLWGDPNKTDLEREYFTRDTDFWDEVLGKSARPLTWDHAQDDEFKANPLIGKTVEWEDDEVGRWAVSVLDKTHQYRKAIDALIEKKALGSAAIAVPVIGSSSDSAPQYVKRKQVGKSIWLERWPWFATALTPTPCEPRMIGSDGGGIEFLKSLGVQIPDTRTAWEWNKQRYHLSKFK